MPLLSLIGFWVVSLAGTMTLGRMLMLTMAAQRGRPLDLAKNAPNHLPSVRVALVTSFLTGDSLVHLKSLLESIEQQAYPMELIELNMVTTREQLTRLPHPNTLPGFLNVWVAPSSSMHRGQALTWLSERLLTKGGPSRIFVFLAHDARIKPDFAQQVALKAIETPVFQGYVGLKNPPKGLIELDSSLTLKQFNRIEQSGLFHCGFSSSLQLSGWGVRQEVLEMLPFRQPDPHNLQDYQARLTLAGFTVQWAPHVVVYTNAQGSLTQQWRQDVHAMGASLATISRYGMGLVRRFMFKRSSNALGLVTRCLMPAQTLVGLVAWVQSLIELEILPPAVAQIPIILPSPLNCGWTLFLGGYMAMSLVSMMVARLALLEMIQFALVHPFTSAIKWPLMPVMVLLEMIQSAARRQSSEQRRPVGKRFDETQPTQKARSLFSIKSLGGGKPEKHELSMTDIVASLDAFNQAREEAKRQMEAMQAQTDSLATDWDDITMPDPRQLDLPDVNPLDAHVNHPYTPSTADSASELLGLDLTDWDSPSDESLAFLRNLSMDDEPLDTWTKPSDAVPETATLLSSLTSSISASNNTDRYDIDAVSEGLDPIKDAYDAEPAATANKEPLKKRLSVRKKSSAPAPVRHEKQEPVALRLGDQSTEAMLTIGTVHQTSPSGQPTTDYYLRLEYKQLSFTTAMASELTEAYAELQSRLAQKGIALDQRIEPGLDTVNGQSIAANALN